MKYKYVYDVLPHTCGNKEKNLLWEELIYLIMLASYLTANGFIKILVVVSADIWLWIRLTKTQNPLGKNSPPTGSNFCLRKGYSTKINLCNFIYVVYWEVVA